MAVLAHFGGVQPSEYRQMRWVDAQKLGQHLLALHGDVSKARVDVDVELLKVELKSLARLVVR